MRMHLAVLLLAVAHTASAATFRVGSTADEVDQSPGNGVCRTASGVCTLRAAIQEANALTGTDRIEVPANTYRLSIAGTGEHLSANGDLDITSSLTIVGDAGAVVVIDGSGISASLERIIHVVSGTVTMRNLQFTGGFTTDSGGVLLNHGGNVTLDHVEMRNSFAAGDGGCIRNNGGQSNLWITNSTFTGCDAFGGGGAIANDNSGSLDLETSTLLDNSANDGGAVYNHLGGEALICDSTIDGNSADQQGGGVANIDAEVTIQNVAITNNDARWGGGVFQNEPTFISQLYMSVVTITGNVAAYSGGGVYAYNGYMTLDLGDITDNQVTDGQGGGLFLWADGPPMSITQTTVSRNTATAEGGGMMWLGVIDLERSTVDNNTAAAGGGLYLAAATGSRVFKTTISTNTATADGGGIYLAGELDLYNATVGFNAAVRGGGLFQNGSALEVDHVILASSTSGGDCQSSGSSFINSRGRTMVQRNLGCSYTPDPFDLPGVNPYLQPLRNNGGPTRTHAITTGSRAYNGGIASGCGLGGATDQRNFAAPARGVCDIGAFELQ